MTDEIWRWRAVDVAHGDVVRVGQAVRIVNRRRRRFGRGARATRGGQRAGQEQETELHGGPPDANGPIKIADAPGRGRRWL